MQRFRDTLNFHGMFDSRSFTTPREQWATYCAIFILTIPILSNGYSVFFPARFTASGFPVSLIDFAIFLVLYIRHKIWYCRTGKEEIHFHDRWPKN